MHLRRKLAMSDVSSEDLILEPETKVVKCQVGPVRKVEMPFGEFELKSSLRNSEHRGAKKIEVVVEPLLIWCSLRIF